MSKKRSLFVQSMTAIEASFTLGYDKHSSKRQSEQPDHSWRVYSFAGKANLLDTAHNLCEYIKEHYPEVDKVRQIRPEYCQEWLDSKAKGGCSLNILIRDIRPIKQTERQRTTVVSVSVTERQKKGSISSIFTSVQSHKNFFFKILAI